MPRLPRSPASTWCTHAIAWCALLVALPAAADICKYADKDGNLHYTNVAPEKGWKKISCGVGVGGNGTSAERGTKTPAPPGFPRVDAGTQKSRDDMRRKVLTEELATEERLLAEARLEYANGAPMPFPDEKDLPQRYADRIAKLRQSVALHEKNIEALKKELAASR